MAYPIQLQIFTTFMGTQEGIHSVALPDIFSSSGSRNLWIDKLGRAKKILGYSKQNSSAVTTNTGSSATRLTALRAYRKTVGTDPRQVLGLFDDGSDEVELWYSANDGETWTFIHDFGSEEVGIRPDFAQVDDVLYIALGNAEKPRTWNGSTLADAGPTSRSPVPAAAEGSTGQLNGTYTWKLVSVDEDGVRVAGSVTSNVLSVEDKSAALTWTAETDATIAGYELYRTIGVESEFYFVTTITPRTTASYTDNTGDDVIVTNRTLEEHGDAPPQGAYFVEPHKQRLWWGRTNANPRRLQWSDPGQPDQVGTNNYLDFTDESHGSIGDVITGLSGDYDGMLVVFQEQSIWTVSGTGQIANSIMDWRRTRTNAITGTVSHNSVVTVPAGAIYTDTSGKQASVGKNVLAYFTPLGDIRLFDGNNDTIISTAVKTTLSQFAYAYRKKVHAIHDIERGHVIWFFPGPAKAAEDARECTQAVVWNYRWGVWYEWPDMPLASATTLENADDAQLILAGESQTTKGGYCYEFFTGDSFDGSNIPARWMTKILYGQDGQQPLMAFYKRWRWLDFIAEADADVTLTVEWMAGSASDEAVSRGAAARSLVPVGLALITADGGRIVATASERSPIVTHNESTQRIIKMQSTNGYYVEDVGLRVRISDDSADGSWSLEGMTLGYQTLPGASRRMQG